MSGCDMTSAPFGKGKSSFLNSIMESGAQKDVSDKMNDVWADQEEIGQASIRAFILMYGGKKDDKLKKLRYMIYFVFIFTLTLLLYLTHL